MNKKIIATILVIIILIGLGFGSYFLFFDNNDTQEKPNEEVQEEVVEKVKEPEPTINIVNVNSKTRPFAVMINNLDKARPYQSGLQDAHIVYEMIVEGGITRLLAVFKDQTTSRIGPVRSSRHYYLDYAIENDAIYVHWGWSPQAQTDIGNMGINNLNGLFGEGLYRDQNLLGKIDLEHTAVTDIGSLTNAVANKGYRTEYYSDNVEAELPYKYSVKEINLRPDVSDEEFAAMETDVIVANNVTIPYSNYVTSSYVYDATNKYYLRYVKGIEHKDYITGEQYHFKNIIILKVRNYNIPGDYKGRQTLENIGTGDGYVIMNGYARPITWSKESRYSKTILKYNDGEEVKLNDGNTFVQIEPIDQIPTISA